MNLEITGQFFFWCSIINFSTYLLSFLFVTLAKNFTHKIHGRLFGISEIKAAENIHAAMINYKTFIFLFNVVPWIVIEIIN